MEKWKSIKTHFPTFPQYLAMMEMPKLLECAKRKKKDFSHILTITWKSQLKLFESNDNNCVIGFSTLPHSLLLFENKYKILGGFMRCSNGTFYEFKLSFRPLFFCFTFWIFWVKIR